MSKSPMRRRILQAMRAVWISVGVALLVLSLIEGVARLAFALRDRGDTELVARTQPYPDADQDWVKEYLRENDAQQVEWHSYVYWRTKPYYGKYINIDEKGLRRTWNSTFSPSPNHLRIFMFGGSTMWGEGARDEFTIPSLVSKKLTNRSGKGVWVTNFGEDAYVSTQEVIALMLELRRGNVPDIAVFYDGVNDGWAAFQSGVSGIPQNERNRVAEFNLRHHLNWRWGFVTKLALYRLSQSIVTRSDGSLLGTSPRRSLGPTLADAVIGTYLDNLRLVDALARNFGFRAVYFWQPTIYTKKNLSDREESWYVQSGPRGGGGVRFAEEYRGFNGAFKQKIKKAKIENVYDLSGIFEEEASTIFIDRFHVSEVGNDKIADIMAETLHGIVRGR